MTDNKTEKKIAVRSLLFATEEEAMNKIVDKEYIIPEDMTVQEISTTLPKKIRVQLQGKTVIGIGQIPVASFDPAIFTAKEDETEEEANARLKMSQKFVELMNAVLEKESLRLAKADVFPADFESFLDNLTATRQSADITVKDTTDLVKEWLRKNNAATKERGKPVFFDSASKLIDCIKSRATALQFFNQSAPEKVDMLVQRFYEMLCVFFKMQDKPTTVLVKWYTNRDAGSKEQIVIDNLDDLI